MATSKEMLSRRIQLSNSLTTPQIHLGLYMMSGPETTRAVKWALEAGYRGFDSAQWYDNERETAAAIRAFSSPSSSSSSTPPSPPPAQDPVFYTTKLRSNSTSYEAVRSSIRDSVAAAGGPGRIDLFLLHSPYGGRAARLTSWRAVADAVRAGEVRSGGVSNFGARHIEELMEAVGADAVRPVVNQIEVHPFNTQVEIRAACARHGIAVQAYAPLARGMRFRHPAIVEMSARYGYTPAQLMVRWSIQHGFITLPKSAKKERILSNADVGGPEISAEDMKALDGLDEKLVTDWDPTNAP